jgi:hypothetical protein
MLSDTSYTEIRPHKTAAQLIVESEGGVFAPDSADPWPSDIWSRVDLEAVEEDLARLHAQEDTASPQELRNYTESSGIYFSPDERKLLANLGETSLR